jgi:cytochrome c-type biogenesis protein
MGSRYGLGKFPLVPMLGFDIETLRISLQEASLAGVGVSFLTGLVFSFNPVSFASIPVVLAYVTKARTQGRAVLLGTAFVTGMLVTHAALGVAAALGGEWVKSSMGHEWELLLGPSLVMLGLIWPGWLRIRLPWISLRGKRVAGMWGAFLLGIPFSVAICPFCTPALVVTLTASAAIGSAPFGLALLLAFALGRSIPILLGAWSIGWLESLKGLQRSQKAFELVAGVTLILAGLYLVGDYVINHH